MPLKTPELTKFTTASPNIVTYNYTDIINGLGVIVIYVSKFSESGGDYWQMVTERMYSALRGSSASFSPGSFTIDMTPFNTPRTAKGTATISCKGYASAGNWTMAATLYHVSGATETAITSTITTGAMISDEHGLIALPITEKLFATGDFLRLKITGAGTNLQIGADTLGTTGNPTGDKTFQINMPFKIDN